MKKWNFLFAVILAATTFVACSDDDNGGGNTSGDPIVGVWRQVSETENGVPQTLTSCDLQEETEFKANGGFTVQDYDLVDGICELNDINEPGLVVNMTWEKVADNSYVTKFFANGMLMLELPFTTQFSNNNQTVTTTATDPEDGTVAVAVLERQ